MADGFGGSNILVRFGFAVLLVFASFNPEGYSFYHWALQPLLSDVGSFSVLKGFVGVVLMIGWVIFLRATINAFGPIGITLAIAFFGMLMWLIVDFGIVPADSVRGISYLVEIALCGVLSMGMSWSHIRRRMSGQVDTDDVEE